MTSSRPLTSRSVILPAPPCSKLLSSPPPTQISPRPTHIKVQNSPPPTQNKERPEGDTDHCEAGFHKQKNCAMSRHNNLKYTKSRVYPPSLNYGDRHGTCLLLKSRFPPYSTCACTHVHLRVIKGALSRVFHSTSPCSGRDAALLTHLANFILV